MKQIILLACIVFCTNTLLAQDKVDEQDLNNLITTLQKGWNSASGETFASAFSEPHDFIVWNGYYSKNNTVQKNAETHQWIFNTMYKDTQLFYKIDKIKFLSSDIALIHVLGAVTLKTEARPKDPQVLISVIVQKKEGQWKIVSFHNLDLEVFQNEDMLKGAPVPPTVMYASWYSNESK